MIFRIDYEIKNEDDIKKFYSDFCEKYIEQIKNKLDFQAIKLTKDKTINKEVNSIDNKIENNKINIDSEENKINIIRFEMVMVNPINRKNIRQIHKKPEIVNRNSKSSMRNKRKKIEVTDVKV